MPRLSGPQRELWRLVVDAVAAVDDVFRTVARDVRRILDLTPTLTKATRPGILRQIDRVLDRAFGLTRRAALISDLFRTILIHTDRAAAAPFQSLFRALERAVMERSPALWPRIRLRLLTGGRGEADKLARVFAAVNGPTAQTQRVLRAASLDPNRRWVRPGGYRLSDRVWKQGRAVRRNIDDILRDGIRRGDGPLTVAERLEQYLNPDAAPTKYLRDGRLVTRNVSRTPWGYGSSYARTLARTELMRVNGMATVEAAKMTPGVRGVQWRLSNAHSDQDECDDNARRDRYGLGAGVYPANNVPRYPNHSNELCVLTIAMKPRNEVVDDLVAMYGGL